ncbi:hypothetical protein AB0H42_25405 [Nocardia sp. NPDC050799]|uniref:hypothetical protein n=1 Tax=Nocardia sp. NPDC050799 TaxID=3154842 RepID=UPI0033FE993B
MIAIPVPPSGTVPPQAGSQKRDELARLDSVAKRLQVRKAILEREPAAVLVGDILLAGIAITLIVGMFAHTRSPEP